MPRAVPVRAGTMRLNWRTLRAHIPSYLFILPQYVLFIVFLVLPVVRGVQISLHDWKIMAQAQRFIGSANYAELLRDPTWWKVLGNSITFTLLVMLINTTLALLVAVNIKRRFPGRNFFRTVFYLPSVLSVTVVGILAFRVWDAREGLLNSLIVGVFQGQPLQPWAGHTAILTLAITTVWWTFGFPMLVFVAGLSAVPETVYEAAKIDGAGAWQLFAFITLPLITPTLLFVLSLQFITHMQMFGQAYQLRESADAQTVFVYLFDTSWKFFRFGYASAMGVVLTVILLVVTRVLFALFGRRFEY